LGADERGVWSGKCEVGNVDSSDRGFMTNIAHRRVRNLSVTLLAFGLVWAIAGVQERSLGSSAFTSGYVLLAVILFLALYNLRKKLPFLPLGSSAAWLQWHLYAGTSSAGLFALHIGPKWPNGLLETTLAIFYLLTFGSGVIGLYLTRTIPRQLARAGDELIYERIPAFRRQLAREANQTVLDGVTASGATTLADFYAGRLHEFFQRPRGTFYLLRPTSALRRALMREMQDIRRYLSDREQAACERLFALVRRKDDLDFHEARQRLLKLWLFAHIGLTYTLVLLAMAHGLAAHAFHGGAA
jgi:hypothetical protein